MRLRIGGPAAPHIWKTFDQVRPYALSPSQNLRDGVWNEITTAPPPPPSQSKPNEGAASGGAVVTRPASRASARGGGTAGKAAGGNCAGRDLEVQAAVEIVAQAVASETGAMGQRQQKKGEKNGGGNGGVADGQTGAGVDVAKAVEFIGAAETIIKSVATDAGGSGDITLRVPSGAAVSIAIDLDGGTVMVLR
eukprot:COSAG05_NODE_3792_length_1834_cov_4.086912_2_plen_193_part_00